MKTIRDFRLAIGKTQREMAKELGISLSLYEKLESGDKKFSRDLLTKIKKKYPLIDITIFLDL